MACAPGDYYHIFNEFLENWLKKAGIPSKRGLAELRIKGTVLFFKVDGPDSQDTISYTLNHIKGIDTFSRLDKGGRYKGDRHLFYKPLGDDLGPVALEATSWKTSFSPDVGIIDERAAEEREGGRFYSQGRRS